MKKLVSLIVALAMVASMAVLVSANGVTNSSNDGTKVSGNGSAFGEIRIVSDNKAKAWLITNNGAEDMLVSVRWQVSNAYFADTFEIAAGATFNLGATNGNKGINNVWFGGAEAVTPDDPTGGIGGNFEGFSVTFVNPVDFGFVTEIVVGEEGEYNMRDSFNKFTTPGWEYWAMNRAEGNFKLTQASGTHVGHVFQVVADVETGTLADEYYWDGYTYDQAGGCPGEFVANLRESGATVHTSITSDVTLTLVLVGTPAGGGDDPTEEEPIVVNLGFIGYYIHSDRVMSTSFYWQQLNEGDMIDWDAVEAAYADWVAQGGLAPNTTVGWHTSGFAPLTFADGAEIGYDDFSFAQLEGYYRAYFVATGYVLPTTFDCELCEDEGCCECDCNCPPTPPSVVNKGCQNCEGQKASDRCDGSGRLANGRRCAQN